MSPVTPLLIVAGAVIGAALAWLAIEGRRYEREARAMLERHPSFVDDAWDHWQGEEILHLRPDPYLDGTVADTPARLQGKVH